MDLRTPLRAYGLTEKETDIYITLLRLGSCNLQEIARKLEYPRTTVYNTINNLIAQGLVSKTAIKGIAHYHATDPTKLADKLEQKQQLLNAIIPQLTQLQGSIGPHSSIELYEGHKGVYTVLSDVFSVKQETYYFGGYTQSLPILSHLPAQARMMRLERKIRAHIVIDPADDPSFHTPTYKRLTKVRFLPSLRDFPAMVFIYGQKVAMFTVQGELVGIIIHNKELAKAMKLVFDIYWSMGTPAKL